MKFENTEVFNIGGALRGMRNPMNSWALSDSMCGEVFQEDLYAHIYDTIGADIGDGDYESFLESRVSDFLSWESADACYATARFIGPADLALAQKLIKAGPEHRKFMRQIFFSVDITMPRYVWTEFDTYKIGITRNSCSTMHKLFNKDFPISLDMFEYDPGDNALMMHIVSELNTLRKQYLGSGDASILQRAKMLLPEGFLQKATITGSYENLRNAYFQRENHRISHWNTDFTGWIKSLPYGEDLITYK